MRRRLISHHLFRTIAAASIIAASLLDYTRTNAQEPKTKIRIANSAMSVTSLALLAAREWKLFSERGLEAEIILMSPAITVPAMIAGEIDYFAGVGPGVASASLSGLPFRAVWVSSDKVSYSLVTHPKFKTLQELRGKKIGVTGSLGATNHVSLVIALEKLGMSPKDFNISRCRPPKCCAPSKAAFSTRRRSIRRLCFSR
jgi:ABC-type nitrate/sulfonate/bicarbonate transport system substrate-binding protein